MPPNVNSVRVEDNAPRTVPAGTQARLHRTRAAGTETRHTLVTALAESGAGDPTIMDLAGHVSRQMLRATRTFAWKPSARPWKVL